MKRKNVVLFLSGLLIVSLIVSLVVLSVNEFHYKQYLNEILMLGKKSSENILRDGSISEQKEFVEKRLVDLEMKDIVVDFSIQKEHQEINVFYIEATPPPSKLDKFIHREPKPIWAKQSFLSNIQRK